MTRVRVAIIGDFDRDKHSHWATEGALFHSAARLGVSVEPHWIATPSVLADEAQLDRYDGIWGAPGSPFVAPDGMLNAIRRAREQNQPYLGTCAGFQCALIELSRNVLGLPDADSVDNPSSPHVVITMAYCPVPDYPQDRPRLSGARTVRPIPGTRFAHLCGENPLCGEFFCTMEANPDYLARWETAGLRIAGLGDADEMRAFELPRHRFFMATLFQPQLSSSFERPHPLVTGFLDECARDRRAG